MELYSKTLEALGAIALGYTVYLTGKYLYKKLMGIKANPLKQYIRKVVLDYLNELSK